MSKRVNDVGGVLGVVVTYHPEKDALGQLLQSLAAQVDAVIVVDNTPGGSPVSLEVVERIGRPKSELLQWGENRGIGEALNAGIEYGKTHSYELVLLSDQDSLPASNMTDELLAVLEEARAEGVAVGCVSPEYFDRTTGQAFPFQVQRPGRLFYSSAGSTDATPWIEALTTITSGSLIPIGVLEEVGGMRDEYFIEHVDIEWGHRVRSRGYVILGTARARLYHQLGSGTFRVWMGRWRLYGAYAPVRLYYKFRNFVLMCRLPYVSFRWKLRASWFWLGQIYAYIIFSPRRWKNLMMIVKGLWDGMLGVSGSIERR